MRLLKTKIFIVILGESKVNANFLNSLSKENVPSPLTP